MLTEDESNFWMEASQPALAEVWDNPQDDVYKELLKPNGGDNHGPNGLP
jgi:hypothetical protein